MKFQDKIKVAVLLLLAALAVLASFLIDVPEFSSLQSIKLFVESFGTWKIAVFILVLAVVAATFVPGSIFTLASGALFGPFWGMIYAVVGAVIGASVAFLLARYLGEPFVSHQMSSKWSQIEKHKRALENESFSIIVVLRLIPLVPFSVLTLVLGLTKIRFREFIAATTIGMLPGTFAYVYAGHSLSTLNLKGVGVALLILSLLVVVGILFKNKKKLPFIK